MQKLAVDSRREMAFEWLRFGFEQITAAASFSAKGRNSMCVLDNLRLEGISNMHKARMRLNELREKER